VVKLSSGLVLPELVKRSELFLELTNFNPKLTFNSAYLAGAINSSINNLRIKELSDGNIVIAFSALVSDKGTILNAESIPKPLSSAREYESVQVRYFDTYLGKERSTIWYSVLEKSTTGSKYTLSKTLVNSLEGTEFNFPTWPVDAMGDDGEIQLSENGILFLALDPKIDTSRFIASKLWHIWIKDFTSPPKEINEIHAFADGVFTSPVFSPNGKGFAFLATKSFTGRAEFNRIFVVPSYPLDAYEIELVVEREKDGWDLNPASLAWSNSV